MKNVTLIIMAAGIGSRFGGGIKQLEPVGPSGEIIMDYSIYDALEAGFNKIVFVIRKDLEKDFKEVIGNRIEKVTNVEYVYQELDKIPATGSVPEGRVKPWGTGQAILCCKGVVNEPFGVINADDYYGKDSFKTLYKKLVELNQNPSLNGKKHSCALVCFTLGNTLSEFGGVTRGICSVDDKMVLTHIVETKNIVKTSTGAKNSDTDEVLDVNSHASMNMWGFLPSFFDELEEGFEKFFLEETADPIGKEYLLPQIVAKLMQENLINVFVVPTTSTWFGVTYKEDKPFVVESVKNLIDNGTYSAKLFDI